MHEEQNMTNDEVEEALETCLRCGHFKVCEWFHSFQRFAMKSMQEGAEMVIQPKNLGRICTGHDKAVIIGDDGLPAFPEKEGTEIEPEEIKPSDVAEDAVVTPEEPLKEIVARGIPAEAISTLRAALQVENLTRKNAYILKAAEQMGISPEG